MKERPILFSAPMVRALLDGSKTQTRRVMKPQMIYGDVCSLFESWYLPKGNDGGILWPNAKDKIISMCPYGQPGDRLWVRESFQYRGASYDGRPVEESEWFRCYGQGGASDNWDPNYPQGWEPSRHMKVRALTGPGEQEDEGTTGWVTKRIPGIHMPRWASRITLGITGVRVERLQDISEADADAECFAGNYPGKALPELFPGPPGDWGHLSMAQCYERLWESINGPSSWELNPWVWVVEFAVLNGGTA